MKNLLTIIIVLFTAISINAQSLAGVWNTGEDNTKIEITENNGVFSGKIFSSDNAEAVIGKQIIKNLRLSNGEYNGQLFAARRGEWYDAVLKRNGNQLDITIKVGWVTKSITWTKG